MLSVADAVQPVRQRGNDMRLAAAGGSVDQARVKRTAQPLLRRVDGLLLVGAEFAHPNLHDTLGLPRYGSRSTSGKLSLTTFA